jgi:CheY-like chemotaxis protein
MRMAVEHNLRLDTFQVLTASTGREGIEMAQKHKPDVILLDWMMPEMDGLEVLQALKKDGSTRKIPIFMFTAKSMMDEREEATDVGADGYITKPFDPVELGEIIRKRMAMLGKHAKKRGSII